MTYKAIPEGETPPSKQQVGILNKTTIELIPEPFHTSTLFGV
jgi:hypothetical protein